MRAVISGASLYLRPRRKTSKKRGGSKMFKRASVTPFLLILTKNATWRVAGGREGTLVVFSLMLFVRLTFLTEWFSIGIERPVRVQEILLRHGKLFPTLAQ